MSSCSNCNSPYAEHYSHQCPRIKKVAVDGSSTNDRANTEVSRELAQEAQSEAPSVEDILNDVLWFDRDNLDETELLKEAVAKINRLIVENQYYILDRLVEVHTSNEIPEDPRVCTACHVRKMKDELSNNLNKELNREVES